MLPGGSQERAACGPTSMPWPTVRWEPPALQAPAQFLWALPRPSPLLGRPLRPRPAKPTRCAHSGCAGRDEDRLTSGSLPGVSAAGLPPVMAPAGVASRPEYHLHFAWGGRGPEDRGQPHASPTSPRSSMTLFCDPPRRSWRWRAMRGSAPQQRPVRGKGRTESRSAPAASVPCVHPQPHPDGNSSKGFRKLLEPSRLAVRHPGVLSGHTGFSRCGINTRNPAPKATLTCPAVRGPGVRVGVEGSLLRPQEAEMQAECSSGGSTGKPALHSLGLLGASGSRAASPGLVPAEPRAQGTPCTPPRPFPSSGYSSAFRFVKTKQMD